ncbi:pleckstrin homology domain-containing family F member 2-like [Ruditapes philippinarum]|uniref:pleckstrin homology domain-containing family F member 2-like n=1 Tax=Ruditapes philippinarum TaxID=129788 RepID=UPI00295AF5A8|nr:pleckstrin homology domain-containing family F member 2-like [Ruditapes philippinarum]
MVDRLVNSESNTRRIACVEQCFGSSGQPLAVPGRVLVGEGVLTKMCRKKPKPRQFFLFNDALVYGNIVINKKKYNKQHIMPLEDVKIEGVEDVGNHYDLRNGWKLISPKKSFVVYAATGVEKQQWISHIKKCVSDLLHKRGLTQEVNSENDSPVWVPDSSASKCMHCKRSQFSMLNRRHHCRKCGLVVCDDCSSKRWLLPQQSSKPLRVCLTCFGKLSSAKNPSESGITNTPDDSSGEDTDDEDDDAVYQGIPEDQFQTYD